MVVRKRYSIPVLERFGTVKELTLQVKMIGMTDGETLNPDNLNLTDYTGSSVTSRVG